jgi:hypothetical protein
MYDRSVLRAPARVFKASLVAPPAKRSDFTFTFFDECLHRIRQQRRDQQMLRVDRLFIRVLKFIFENFLALGVLQNLSRLASSELNGYVSHVGWLLFFVICLTRDKPRKSLVVEPLNLQISTKLRTSP